MSNQTTTYPSWWYERIPEDELPVGHRPVTIHALLYTFQVLAWIAVLGRLYCSGLARRGFGLDDLFVVISILLVTFTTVLTASGTSWGMGQHYGVVTNDPWLNDKWYRLYFGFTLSYFASASTIKLSILLQYLRLFEHAESRRPRYVTLGVMAMVCIWGICFFAVQLFSCFPISDAWNLNGQASCHLLMSTALNEWLTGVLIQAITNMMLDYSILSIPFIYRRYLSVERKGRTALIGLFSVGGCVATISAVRFILIITAKGGVHPTQDASWNAPAFMIPSALEIQLAVICASAPVFWPVLIQSLRLDQIRVTREITLHTENRSPGEKRWKHHSEGSETELRDLSAAETYNGSDGGANDLSYTKNPYNSDWQITDGENEKRDGVNTAAFSNANMETGGTKE